MPFPHKTVLVVGATSGIGLALAEKMIENGVHVIGVGRRQEKLDELAQKHGKDKWSSVKFDITNLPGIPSFVQNVTEKYTKLDCVVLNSGIQRKVDFTKPESIDLESINTEFTTNYFSHIHLIKHFLPFLQAQSIPTSLIFTTSGLALVPIVRCPNYCASKAAMHSLILMLREQIKGSNVKIIELFPPAVQTELHDAKHQPDIKDGGKIGMPLDEFTKQAWEGLEQGKEDIPVGPAVNWYEVVETGRQKEIRKMVEMGAGKL